jgi:hypothetical protein
MYEFAERLSRFTEPFYVRLGDLRAILKGPRPPGRRWMRHPFRIHVAESSEAAPGLPSNRVPVAAQLLTLTYHPGLDLVVVFRARGSHSGSGMVVEMPRLHKHSPQHPKQRDADEGGSAIGREPSGPTARSPRRARRARRFRGRRNSVQTTSRSRCETWRESLGALPSDAEDSPPIVMVGWRARLWNIPELNLLRARCPERAQTKIGDGQCQIDDMAVNRRVPASRTRTSIRKGTWAKRTLACKRKSNRNCRTWAELSR